MGAARQHRYSPGPQRAVREGWGGLFRHRKITDVGPFRFYSVNRITSPKLERQPGIKPGPSAWKAEVLPLNYCRVANRCVCPLGWVSVGLTASAFTNTTEASGRPSRPSEVWRSKASCVLVPLTIMRCWCRPVVPTLKPASQTFLTATQPGQPIKLAGLSRLSIRIFPARHHYRAETIMPFSGYFGSHYK